MTATATDSSANISITNNGDVVENGTAATWADGVNQLVISVANGEAQKTYTVEVTKS